MTNHEIMIDRGETQSKPVNFINRKIAALTVAGSMLLGGAGCAESRTVDTSNNIPTSVEDTVGTSETTKLVTPEVTVTPTPAETTIETTVPTTVETTTHQEDIALLAEAGTLDGADTVMKAINGVNVPVYVAKENNAYEVKAGTELGQYYKNVEYNGVMVGAKVCIPEVVKVLYENKLAENPEGESNWVIFVPADISEIENKNTIVDLEKVDSINPNYNLKGVGLKVSFGGEKVSISNPVVDWENQGFNNTLSMDVFTYPKFLGGICNKDIGSGIFINGSFIFNKPIMNNEIKFAAKVVETNDPIYVSQYNQNIDASEKIEDKNILMNEEKFVFLSDEGTMETTTSTTETSN